MSWSLLIAVKILDSLNLFSYSEFLVKSPFTFGPPTLIFRWSYNVLTFSQSMKIISRRRTDETGLNCGPNKMDHNKLNQMIWIIFDPWTAPSRFETSIFGLSILIVIPSCRALLWFLAISYCINFSVQILWIFRGIFRLSIFSHLEHSYIELQSFLL